MADASKLNASTAHLDRSWKLLSNADSVKVGMPAF